MKKMLSWATSVFLLSSRRGILAFTSCSFLLANVALALTPEQVALNDRVHEVWARGEAQLLAAESIAIEKCEVSNIIVPFPYFDIRSKTEESSDVNITIDWNGYCVDGKREGEGTLTWTKIWEKRGRIFNHKRQAQGRLVKGKRLGIWCHTLTRTSEESRINYRFTNSDSGCSVFAGHDKPLTGNYRKQVNGSWEEFNNNVFTGTTLAAGSLESMSTKLLDEAGADKPISVSGVIGQSKIIEDLVRGMRITLAPSTAPISISDKRVAIVLSSNTIKELERYRRERQALIDASSGLNGNAAKFRDEFIFTSNPDRLLANVLRTLKRNAKVAKPEGDLTALQKGKYDYAFILDWKDSSRFDLLGRYDNFPISEWGRKETYVYVACESLTGFLVTPDLKVVKTMPGYTTEGCTSKYADDKLLGDAAYFEKLAGHYRYFLGKGEDGDLGANMVVRLHKFFKQ